MSNDLLLNAGALELMYPATFTKKQAIATGTDLVNKIFADGEIEPLKVWANIARLKEVVNSADKAFRNKVEISSKDNSNGVEFSLKNGSKRLSYEDDPIYLELKEKLSSRMELLKVAQNSTIFDDDGIEVPKVSVTFDKSSITVSF